MCLRVTAGKMRGLKLESLDGITTRPTLDKVKQAIFNMLFDKTYDASVLDLFSGSGSMGIESISRGALFCTFVDINTDAIDIINKNIKKSKTEQNSKVIKSDYVSFLNSTNSKFDLVFLDPPYNSDYVNNSLLLLKQNDLLNKDCIIVVESSKENVPSFCEEYQIIKQKFYGTVCVSLLEAKWKK